MYHMGIFLYVENCKSPVIITAARGNLMIMIRAPVCYVFQKLTGYPCRNDDGFIKAGT